METVEKLQQRKTLYITFFILGIVLVAFNLRPAITSVGPLINSIQRDLGLSHGGAGLITSLPIIAFAVISPLTPRLARKTTNSWTLIIGLIFLLVGMMIRSIANILLLYTGTFLIGVGIAILNVILPGIIKDKFPDKFAFMTSVYTTSMSIVAALASGLSVPLATGMGLGWKNALLIWVIPVITAIVLWFYLLKFDKKQSVSKQTTVPKEKSNLLRSPLAWQIGFFLGLQSFLFYVTVSWLPDILHSQGISRESAGWLLSFTQLIGLPANFFVPIIAGKFKSQQIVALSITSFSIIGFILLLFSTSYLSIVISIIFIGLGLGGTFSLALSFLGLRARDSQQAAELSGMAQSLGYTLAALGPMFIGALFDWTGSWLTPLITLIVVTVLTAFFGIRSGRNRYVA